VAVVCLVLGGVLGTRLDSGSAFSFLDSPATAALTAGAVASAPALDDRHRFRVDLFNPGRTTVRVRVVGLDGWSTTVAANPAVGIAPHRWAQVTFSLPDDCDGPVPPPITALRIRTVDRGTRGHQRVELAAPATALRAVHTRECVPATTLTPRDLGGLWHLEEAEGRWSDLARISLMRFTADGRFTFDPEGLLFQEGDQGMLGTYRLDGTRLRLRADGGYACDAGYTEVWKTTLLSEDLLQLDIVRSDGGYCNSPPGERHVFRRLVREDNLPPDGSVSSR
jgi:hypothetical protein